MCLKIKIKNNTDGEINKRLAVCQETDRRCVNESIRVRNFVRVSFPRERVVPRVRVGRGGAIKNGAKPRGRRKLVCDEKGGGWPGRRSSRRTASADGRTRNRCFRRVYKYTVCAGVWYHRAHLPRRVVFGDGYGARQWTR